jgi:MOSC domain-containing protein
MRVASLHVYPVKGGHRADLPAADVQPWGFAGDRRWMIVDAEGIGVTQRESTSLTGLRATVLPDGLALTAPGLPDLAVAAPGAGPTLRVRTFRSRRGTVPARPAGAEADAWLSTLVDQPVRLVWLHDPTAQTPGGSSGVGLTTVSFADAYPFLLATTASLDALNDWLLEDGEEPVPMTRFRPNLVVSGAAAWDEDGWVGRRLRIGPVELEGTGLCDRCVVTTIDQETGVKGRQPLRMLGRHRNLDQGLIFGLHLLTVRAGRIAVGDEVSLR